ncbi:hypothetical protein [Sphingomonas sp. CFBP 8760]|uniref:hypothetical protein n=1 Tax=Sphingomonas sp. CFBP 8760 TaxID=2775282 RepID=UPI001781BB1C|nr:hypothetical protein [Sphingomonas sp. CFBP 8760]MBD8546730.1 hypothetical protein [Sphingomonas sp. CFBP 8760]
MMLDAAVSDYATRSTLAKRAGTMLAQAEDAITEIVASLPSDVATAMRQLTAHAKVTELEPTGPHQRMEGPPSTVDQSTN